MSDRVFQCPKCNNWYVPVPVKDGAFCFACDGGQHAPHQRTGVVDCHFGHESATAAEIRMAGIVERVSAAVKAIGTSASGMAAAPDRASVTALLTKAETVFAQAEKAMTDVPETLRWAGVLEMPGMSGEAPTTRFKSIETVEELVRNNRRPPEDLAMLRRSVRTCNALADDLPGLMAEARVAIGQARHAAQAWAPQQAIAETDKANKCADCGHESPNAGALASHRKNKHREVVPA